jgi:hypothetical protein
MAVVLDEVEHALLESIHRVLEGLAPSHRVKVDPDRSHLDRTAIRLHYPWVGKALVAPDMMFSCPGRPSHWPPTARNRLGPAHLLPPA